MALAVERDIKHQLRGQMPEESNQADLIWYSNFNLTFIAFNLH